MSDSQWVETPMFILRRSCIFGAIAAWPAGRFLEIGAGTGRLTIAFLERGYHGTCYDLGADNRRVLRQNLSSFRAAADVVDSLDELAPGSFDYLFAFEVLEHVEKDLDALRSWTRFLAPGGRLLASVPAHRRKFGDEDRAVGHHRRYEREELDGLLEDAGLSGIRILTYGFPLGSLTRHGNRWLSMAGGANGGRAGSSEELSIRSGVERTTASRRLARILNRRTLWPFCVLQRLFFKSDLGEGYVVQAVKAPDTAAPTAA